MMRFPPSRAPVHGSIRTTAKTAVFGQYGSLREHGSQIGDRARSMRARAHARHNPHSGSHAPAPSLSLWKNPPKNPSVNGRTGPFQSGKGRKGSERQSEGQKPQKPALLESPERLPRCFDVRTPARPGAHTQRAFILSSLSTFPDS